jgi:hypothetical protein
MAENIEKLKVADKNKRQHKATYSRDKRKGGYLVRVVGPHASQFTNRDVPVSRNDGSESTERLLKLVHSGVDGGEVVQADKGKNYALYTFQAKPREEEDVEF